MSDTKDNFSRQADAYARFRPGYPQALFDWLFSKCAAHNNAWDCATGNGQAAESIAAKFQTVYATDISIKQLDNAHKADNIIYSKQPAEQPSFDNDSFDLVTVAQSLHWFNHEQFFNEVHRVAKNGALFAAWGYNLPRSTPDINAVIDRFYTEVVGAYWDAERRHVDNSYSSIPFPQPALPCPGFSISYAWTVEQMSGYLSSWSAVQHFIKDRGFDPVGTVAEELLKVWGHDVQTVTFPIFMHAFHIQK